MSIKVDFFKVEVVPHDPNWRSAFETESKLIALALKENVVAIHHIGSTAIPQIHAKPIIDMLVQYSGQFLKRDATPTASNAYAINHRS
ncbi:GrpB family protein, partial [Microcoleus sp. B3-A4]|uniref:GrpB family protein n=1 Tax=Microcoleus sp. B3-A4 TaxID=2818653 RepID=UPI002FD6872C